jgi:hypothetical protein
LVGGRDLHVEEPVNSADGRFGMKYQVDGNFVLYFGPQPLWASGTQGTSTGRVSMQTDGNLVVYDGGGVPRWWSGTNGNPGSYLLVQNDGNAVIYNACGNPIWATNTCCH